MSAVRAYAMWRLKDGVEIKKKDLSYFCPGGFTFTHKSGRNISFDFLESATSYIDEDKLIDSDLKEIDDEFITSALEYDRFNDLIQEQYDLEFFRNGKIDFSNSSDEMFCCLDLVVDGKLEEEVDFGEYLEPVYLAVFDPYSEDVDSVELYNKLTPKEYKKYFDYNEIKGE